jgi:hypothetical protein
MKKNSLKYILPLLMVVSLVGCLPEDELEYNGPPLVEFKNHTRELVAAAATSRGIFTGAGTQTDSTRTVMMNVRTVDTIYVQLVGAQRPESATLSFQLRAASTAVEGTHYNFNPANTREVVIPANSSFGYILVNPVANSLPTVGNQVRIDIDLMGNDALIPSPNYDVFLLTLRR